MTRREWDQIVAFMAANWPHQPPPEHSIDKWFRDLEGWPAQQVYAAVESLYRDGRDFPPNGGQIIARLAEFDAADPDHGSAWEIVRKALWKHVPNWTSFYADLRAQSPAVCEAARRYGFEAQSGYLVAEEGMVRAQFRDIYRGVVAERKRDEAYAGLPDAGLRSLEHRPKKAGEVVNRTLRSLKGGAE